jgi:hypothetical protein
MPQHTRAYELPAWLGAFYVPIPYSFTRGPVPHARYDEQVVFDTWNHRTHRVIGRAEARNSMVVVRSWLAWPARCEWWWHRRAQYALMELALRIHLFRGPYAGHFYHEARFGPPDLWGQPLEKWELS